MLGEAAVELIELHRLLEKYYERAELEYFLDTLNKIYKLNSKDEFSSLMIKNFINYAANGYRLTKKQYFKYLPNLQIKEEIIQINNCNFKSNDSISHNIFRDYEDYLYFIMRFKKRNKKFYDKLSEYLEKSSYEIKKMIKIRAFSFSLSKFYIRPRSLFSKIYFIKNNKFRINRVKKVGIVKILIMKNVTLTGGSRFVLYRNKIINPFYNYSQQSEEIRFNDSLVVCSNNNYALIRRKVSKKIKQESVVSLLDSASMHFGHFLGHVITRLSLSKKEDIKLILIDSSIPENYLDFIHKFTADINIEMIDHGESVTVSNLIYKHPIRFFPDHLTNGSNFFHKDLRSNLWDYHHFEKETSPKGELKIALLRGTTSHAQYRNLSNFRELENFLSENEFTFFDYTKADSDKELLITRSKVIVCELGSLSQNLIFYPIYKKKIIFISTGVEKSLEYKLPGYLAAIGNDVIILEGESTSDARQSDYKVDLELFKRALTHLEVV